MYLPLTVRLGCAVGLGLLLATAGARPLAADEIVAVYNAFWAGLPAGRIRLKLDDAGQIYHNEIEIETAVPGNGRGRRASRGRPAGRAVALPGLV